MLPCSSSLLFASCRRTPPCSTAAGASAVAVAAANVDGEELHLEVAQARAEQREARVPHAAIHLGECQHCGLMRQRDRKKKQSA